MQRGVASVFAPLEEGASRALKPARDLVNWFARPSTPAARTSLQAEVQKLRAAGRQAAGRRGRERAVQKLVGLDRKRILADYKLVTARVIGALADRLVLDRDHQHGLERRGRAQRPGGQRRRARRPGHRRHRRHRQGHADHRHRQRRLGAGAAERARRASPSPRWANPSTCCSTSSTRASRSTRARWSRPPGGRTATISSAYPPGIPIGRVQRRDGPASRRPSSASRRAVRGPARPRVRAGADRRARRRGCPDDRHPAHRDPDRADRDRRGDPPGLVLLLPLDPRRDPVRGAGRRRRARAARRRRRRRGLRLRRRAAAGLGAAADARRLLARPALVGYLAGRYREGLEIRRARPGAVLGAFTMPPPPASPRSS